MKKVFSLFFSLVLAFSLAAVAFAHTGGTDSSGGHRDRSTGSYHYHHGYSAHQHKDLDGDGDLDCPYDFVDKSGQNSGSTYRSSYSTSFYSPDPTPIPKEKQKEEFDPSNNLFFIAGLILFSVGIIFLPVLLSEPKNHTKPKNVKTEYVAKPSDVQAAQKALDAYLANQKRSQSSSVGLSQLYEQKK